MPAKILKAMPILEDKIPYLQKKVKEFVLSFKKPPCLKIFLAGTDPASQIYTHNKKKFAENIGASCEIIQLDKSISKEEFINYLQAAATDDTIHGILVQLPLPLQLQDIDLSDYIPSQKDVDAFNPKHLHKIFVNSPSHNMSGFNLIPCTPNGIITLLDYYQYPIKGQHVVIIGRSNIVGRPLTMCLINRDATVTLCHSQTKDLKKHTRIADIIIVAIGKANFLTQDYINIEKPPVVIDVGINSLQNKKICGDVDFKGTVDIVKAITPVPGGVGPLTILSLAENLIKAAEYQQKK